MPVGRTSQHSRHPAKLFKLLACGSREWEDGESIRREMDSIYAKHGKNVLLIHGGARGADSIAAGVARLLGWQIIEFIADWDRWGKSAGMKRNLLMLDQEPELVLAFQKDKSRGTAHTIGEASRRGIPLRVVEQITPRKVFWDQNEMKFIDKEG